MSRANSIRYASPIDLFGNTLYGSVFPTYNEIAVPGQAAPGEIFIEQSTGDLSFKDPISGVKLLRPKADMIALSATIMGQSTVQNALSSLLTYITNVDSGAGGKVIPGVQNTTALAALNTTSATDYPDKAMILVEDNGLYRFDRTSVETPAGEYVVAPTTGSGRWFKIASRYGNHDELRGVNGDGPEKLHLNSSQLFELKKLFSKIVVANGDPGSSGDLQYDNVNNELQFRNETGAAVDSVKVFNKIEFSPAETDEQTPNFFQLKEHAGAQFRTTLNLAVGYNGISHLLDTTDIVVFVRDETGSIETSWKYKPGSEANEIQVFSSVAVTDAVIYIKKMSY